MAQDGGEGALIVVAETPAVAASLAAAAITKKVDGAVDEGVYQLEPDGLPDTLKGSGLKRLSDAAGTHSATFNPALSLYVDSWSDVQTPAQVYLHGHDGNRLRVIDANDGNNRVDGLGRNLGRIGPQHPDTAIGTQLATIVPNVNLAVTWAVTDADTCRNQASSRLLDGTKNLIESDVLPFRRPVIGMFVENIRTGMRVGRRNNQVINPAVFLSCGAQAVQPGLAECSTKVKRHQRRPFVASLHHQHSRVERIQRARSDLMILDALEITVHRQAGWRGDIDLGHTSFERSSRDGYNSNN